MPTTYVLGMNAGLYQGPAGTTDPSLMSEVDNVKDVTLSLEAGEADITTRGNSGWRATAPTLRECTVEFQMVWKPGDAVFEAIKAAFLTAGTVVYPAVAYSDRLRRHYRAEGVYPRRVGDIVAGLFPDIVARCAVPDVTVTYTYRVLVDKCTVDVVYRVCRIFTRYDRV